MPGKAHTVLVLSLIHALIWVGAGCQAAKSNAPRRVSAAYKPKAKKASENATSLPTDPSLAYRGLTHDTVLAALKSSRLACLEQGADIIFDGGTLKIAVVVSSAHAAAETALRAYTAQMAGAIDRHFHGVFEKIECQFFSQGSAIRYERAQLDLAQLVRTGRQTSHSSSPSLSLKEMAAATRLSRGSALSIAERYAGMDYRQILDQSAVLDGAYNSERRDLASQLTIMQRNGYDVSQATRQFLAMEDLVRTRQYAKVAPAFSRTRYSIAEAVAKAQGVSVATSGTQNWQR